MAETVAERLVQTLIDAGIRRVYGIVGDSLNPVTEPVMLHNVLASIQLLAEGVRSFDERCAAGIAPNEKRIREHLDGSPMLVTALNPHIGYEKSAKIAMKAHREGLSLREAALQTGFVTGQQFDEWIRPEDMTHPL